MYRRILVPVDGSAPSTMGLEHALGLAKDRLARVRIVNVVDDRVLLPMMGPYGAAADITRLFESLRENGQQTLKAAAALAAKRRVEADTSLVESRGRAVSDVILAEVRRSRADLIVMGTHGRSGFNRLLLGSDAERVLRDAPVPLLLVRGGKAARRATAKRARAPARRTSSR